MAMRGLLQTDFKAIWGLGVGLRLEFLCANKEGGSLVIFNLEIFLSECLVLALFQ